MMASRITMDVIFTAEFGGAHTQIGMTRINPVTGARRWSPWLGHGRSPGINDEFTRRESVCSECGESECEHIPLK